MQQQQGMVGNHGMMGNQAAMVNAGRCDGYDFLEAYICLNVCDTAFTPQYILKKKWIKSMFKCLFMLRLLDENIQSVRVAYLVTVQVFSYQKLCFSFVV